MKGSSCQGVHIWQQSALPLINSRRQGGKRLDLLHQHLLHNEELDAIEGEEARLFHLGTLSSLIQVLLSEYPESHLKYISHII